jgi:hypothetical protein
MPKKGEDVGAVGIGEGRESSLAKGLAHWARIRRAYNEGFFSKTKTPPVSPLPSCEGDGSIENPFKFPNAKDKALNIPSAAPKTPGYIFALFHPAFLERMDPSVVEAILAVPSIKHKPVRVPPKPPTLAVEKFGRGAVAPMPPISRGRSAQVFCYELDAPKKKQTPYDQFFQALYREFGSCDPDFNGRPRKLNPETVAVLRARRDELFIFGMPEDDGDIFVLPREELIQIKGQYFVARHTHSEFASRDGVVFAAGSFKDLRYNLRTGHFLLHQLMPEERRAIIDRIDCKFVEALNPECDYKLESGKMRNRRLSYSEINIEAEGNSREDTESASDLDDLQVPTEGDKSQTKEDGADSVSLGLLT